MTQIQGTLAYTPSSVTPAALASATADALDPYGFWSADPDSAVAEALHKEGANLLREIMGHDNASCGAASGVADALVQWTGDLRLRFEESREAALRAPAATTAELAAAAADPLFDEGVPAKEFAASLGLRVGRLERAIGSSVRPYGDVGEARFFPSLSRDGWADVVRGAALRAYLPLVDPHGAWAPTDEQASIYDVDLDPSPPESLWDQALRTAIGVLVESEPTPPLETGDVVLAIGGVTTVGLPREQLDQLVYATTDAPTEQPLVVLRHGAVRSLVLTPPEEGLEPAPAPADLVAYRVEYGGGDALVIEIQDVRSDLADELRATFHKEEQEGDRPIMGLLLDLRGNGGGAAEGAIGALGLFLPGAPLFPMVNRDGTIEVDRAPEPPPADRWTRPVATLVDGDTASAAEMIAGALAAYRRGIIVGERTFGKGCAQEFIDDEASVGVLRLTTLLYALPDGSPVQRVGLEPSLLLPPSSGADVPSAHQREADDPNAPPTWRGPDVRDPTLIRSAATVAWPEHHGVVGPARDEAVATALRRLGASKRPAAAQATPRPAHP